MSPAPIFEPADVEMEPITAAEELQKKLQVESLVRSGRSLCFIRFTLVSDISLYRQGDEPIVEDVKEDEKDEDEDDDEDDEDDDKDDGTPGA